MGQGFHLLHVPLVGDGQPELRLFQGQNHGGAGGEGVAVGWSFRRSFVFLLNSQVVPCIGRAWRVTCVCPRTLFTADGCLQKGSAPAPGPQPPPPVSAKGGWEPAEAPGDC